MSDAGTKWWHAGLDVLTSKLSNEMKKTIQTSTIKKDRLAHNGNSHRMQRGIPHSQNSKKFNSESLHENRIQRLESECSQLRAEQHQIIQGMVKIISHLKHR